MLRSSIEKIQKSRAHTFNGWILPMLNFLKMFSSLRILYRRPPFKSDSESRSVLSSSLRPHGLYSPWNSLGQNTRVDSRLPNPGIKPRSPTLQVDSLSAEPQGKPKNTGVGSLSLLQQIFSTQESNWGLLHCRHILYQLSYQGSPR